MTLKERAVDQVPALPSGRLARTRQNRSPVAVKDAATCEAVDERSSRIDVKVLVELAWNV